MSGSPATAAPAVPTASGTLRKVALDTGEFTSARLTAVNRRGEIVGVLRDPEANGGVRAALWRRYDTMIDLGVPGELPTALNNRGDVLIADLIWTNGSLRPVRHPTLSARPTDLNDHLQVTGTLESGSLYEYRAFRWQDGQFTDLGTPYPDAYTRGQAINNRGTVLGTVHDAVVQPVGFVWRDGVTSVFGAGLHQIAPIDINDRDQVLSYGSATEESPVHPYLWQRGKLVDLMAGRAADGIPQDINNAGDVVGSIDSRPVLWRAGRTIHLLPPAWRGLATHTNERGDIAGVAGTGTDNRVFLWRNGHVRFSEPETGTFNRPSVAGVDERGRVAGGLGDELTGENHPVVWIP
ncbi:hypothetical protein AB0M20_33190 [Actinoplanes sp. NPDC051633]|uniref:hypothetical protein n=1 Tax=Actinoplanes sp. NPDC051633 TaxID=3155670 RepID=UPI00342A59AD